MPIQECSEGVFLTLQWYLHHQNMSTSVAVYGEEVLSDPQYIPLPSFEGTVKDGPLALFLRFVQLNLLPSSNDHQLGFHMSCFVLVAIVLLVTVWS
jgi:hypothetical protein